MTVDKMRENKEIEDGGIFVLNFKWQNCKYKQIFKWVHRKKLWCARLQTPVVVWPRGWCYFAPWSFAGWYLGCLAVPRRPAFVLWAQLVSPFLHKAKKEQKQWRRKKKKRTVDGNFNNWPNPTKGCYMGWRRLSTLGLDPTLLLSSPLSLFLIFSMNIKMYKEFNRRQLFLVLILLASDHLRGGRVALLLPVVVIGVAKVGRRGGWGCASGDGGREKETGGEELHHQPLHRHHHHRQHHGLVRSS